MAYVLDYSAGRPTAAAVKAGGYVGVIRYVGFPDRVKCITHGEYADMVNAGLGVALVYENHAGDMLAGRGAGRAAAKLARAHANDLGFPTQRPIYYACDTDVVGAAQLAAVLDYLRGVADVEGAPGLVGVYGEYDVIQAAAGAGVAVWFWQTRAWSGGRLSPRAQLRQEIGTVVIGGIGCDRNTVLAADWGQTGAGVHIEEDDMALFASRDDFDRAVYAQTSAAVRYVVPRALSVAMTGAANSVYTAEDVAGWAPMNLRAQLSTVQSALAASAVREAAQLAMVQQLAGQIEAGGGAVDYTRLKGIIDAAVESAVGRIDVVVTGEQPVNPFHADDAPPA